MTKQEYIKKQREILLKLAEGITWQPYTELSEKKEYFTLEEASEALYNLHLEGVREAYLKGYNDYPKKLEELEQQKEKLKK